MNDLGNIELLRLASWALADLSFVLGILWAVRTLIRAKCLAANEPDLLARAENGETCEDGAAAAAAAAAANVIRTADAHKSKSRVQRDAHPSAGAAPAAKPAAVHAATDGAARNGTGKKQRVTWAEGIPDHVRTQARRLTARRKQSAEASAASQRELKDAIVQRRAIVIHCTVRGMAYCFSSVDLLAWLLCVWIACFSSS